jgi:predicted Zn finger-like uncharacterized protein
MKTTCPHCHTAFRVHEEQLEQHGGDVRCGRCGEIFNGYECLDERDGTHPLAAEKPEPSPPPLPPDTFAQETPDAATAAPASAPAASTPEPVVPDGPEEEAAGPEEEAAEPDEEPPAPAEMPAPQIEAPGAEQGAQEDRPVGRRWPWVMACLFALAGLAAQAGLVFRTELSLSQPGLRPALEQLCSLAGCQIELPRQTEQLSIESSELQADPARVETVILLASLRNRSPHPQAYPLLELTLTDSQDRMVARRTFQPREYHPKADLSAGFAAGSDIQVKLPLQLKDLQAVGYRLYLYYPQT